MWFGVLVVLFWLAGEHWPAFKAALRVTAGITAVIGLLILTKVGFVVRILAALVAIPIDFITGAFGIIRALLFG